MMDREEFQPEDMLFDANLQEFANKVGIICALEGNQKLTTSEAYDRIKGLWKQLKRSKKGLRIGEGDLPEDVRPDDDHSSDDDSRGQNPTK